MQFSLRSLKNLDLDPTCPVWATDSAIRIQTRLLAALEAWPQMRPRNLQFASDTIQEVYDRGIDDILGSSHWKDFEGLANTLVYIWDEGLVSPMQVPSMIATVRWQRLQLCKCMRAIEEAQLAYRGGQ